MADTATTPAGVEVRPELKTYAQACLNAILALEKNPSKEYQAEAFNVVSNLTKIYAINGAEAAEIKFQEVHDDFKKMAQAHAVMDDLDQQARSPLSLTTMGEHLGSMNHVQAKLLANVVGMVPGLGPLSRLLNFLGEFEETSVGITGGNGMVLKTAGAFLVGTDKRLQEYGFHLTGDGLKETAGKIITSDEIQGTISAAREMAARFVSSPATQTVLENVKETGVKMVYGAEDLAAKLGVSGLLNGISGGATVTGAARGSVGSTDNLVAGVTRGR